MLILTKSVLSMMIAFLFSILFSLFLIPYLRKLKAGQRLSIYLEDTHKKKQGTPTMGGFIFLVPTLFLYFVFYFFQKVTLNYNVIIVLFTFFAYGMIGFLDDYLIIKRNNNKGLTERQKMFLEVIVAVTFFYFFMKAGNEPLLWIHSFNLKLNIGWLYGLFILFVLIASSNAVNLTDGLDGLAGGLSAIAFLTFGILSWNTGWLEGYQDIAIFCFLLIGSLFGFLIFNTYPAKIFMGDTGSLSLGATLGTIAILTRHELLLILIGLVFVIETVSCIIQRIYYKFTKKRIFPMTPIHHTFEKKGFKETDIVKIFWVVGLLASMIALGFGVWL